MAWNETPQAKVLKFAEPLFPGRKVEVRGYRPTRGTGGRKSPYTAHLFVDGRVVATAQERNWRQAYKILQITISKGNIL